MTNTKDKNLYYALIFESVAMATWVPVLPTLFFGFLTFGLEAWRGTRACGEALHGDVGLQLDLKHWLSPGNHCWVKLDRLHPGHRGH